MSSRHRYGSSLPSMVLGSNLYRVGGNRFQAFVRTRKLYSNNIYGVLQCHSNLHGKVRYLSNESFKETLDKIRTKRKEEDKSDNENSDAETKSSANSDKQQTNNVANLKEMFNNTADFLRNTKSIFDENLKIAWSEMIGNAKESTLERKFEQAESFRRGKSKEDNDENTDESTATNSGGGGSSALVIVPQAKSYWEQMASRLDAPLIRSILKGASKIGKVAADTPVGQQAQKIGQSVKEKMEDAREFWETSQNPIVHTLSGVWENLTGETEEGQTIAEIRKKDPTFVKVFSVYLKV